MNNYKFNYFVYISSTIIHIMKIKILITLSLILTMSCSKSPIIDNSNIYEENLKTDYELFDSANQLLGKKLYDDSIKELEKIEAIFPNSQYSAKAKIVRSYIYFIQGEYEKTKAIAENYIKYYPGNKDVIYAYYIEAMTNYVQVKKPEYNQKYAIEAKNKFLFINNAYQNNKYEQDINLKLNIINNTISSQLLVIGKYYEKEKNYIAALTYYLDIYKNFEETQKIEEALYSITKIYIKINEEENATKYASILGHNYPDSKWYKKTYQMIKKIKPEIINNSKWFEKLNPVRLIMRDQINEEKEWFEPIKPKFKIN